MGETTAISWCDHTFNPWIGCMKVSPACDGCYAEALMDKRYGRVAWGGPGAGVGTRVKTADSNWLQPRKWNRAAQAANTFPFVFCASLADVFDNEIDPAWRLDLFRLIGETPRLVWLLLTKRPQNIAGMLQAMALPFVPPNIALGTTCEDQKRLDQNAPALLSVAARYRLAFSFLSCEPLLGPLRMARYLSGVTRIDWVITGGETDQGDHKARPSHPAWFLDIRDQCRSADVPFHHKQNGEWCSPPAGVAFDTSLGGAGKPPAFLVSRQDGTVHCFRETAGDDAVVVVKLGKARAGRAIMGQAHDARADLGLVGWACARAEARLDV